MARWVDRFLDSLLLRWYVFWNPAEAQFFFDLAEGGMVRRELLVPAGTDADAIIGWFSHYAERCPNPMSVVVCHASRIPPGRPRLRSRRWRKRLTDVYCWSYCARNWHTDGRHEMAAALPKYHNGLFLSVLAWQEVAGRETEAEPEPTPALPLATLPTA